MKYVGAIAPAHKKDYVRKQHDTVASVDVWLVTFVFENSAALRRKDLVVITYLIYVNTSRPYQQLLLLRATKHIKPIRSLYKH